MRKHTQMSAKQKTKVAIELPLTHKGSEEAYTKNPNLRPPLDNNHIMMLRGTCGNTLKSLADGGGGGGGCNPPFPPIT